MRRVLVISALFACGTVVAIPVATAAQAKTIRLIEVERTLAPMGGLDARFSSPPRAGQGIAITSDLYFWKGSSRGAHAGERPPFVGPAVMRVGLSSSSVRDSG